MAGGRWLLVATGMAVLVAACGGPSKADFIASADPVCTDANRQLKAAGPLPKVDVRDVTAAQLPSVGAYLDRVLPILRSEASRLHELGTPTEDGATVDDIRMYLDDFVSRLEAADRDAHRGDDHAFTPELDKALVSGFQAQTIAGNYGFAVCGKLPELSG